MDAAGYTIVSREILRTIINPMGFGNAFLLLAPHGEIIYDAPPIPNDPVLAMCYSGPPITVNYSDEDENKRVLQIVDDNMHSSLRRMSFTRRKGSAVVAFAPEHRASQSRINNPNHFKKIIALDPGNPDSIHKELVSLASAIKRGDTQHSNSISRIRTVAPSQVNDSRKSRLFSQSYPVTKMIDDRGGLIPLRSINHPNKRYTLRADDDKIPEIARGNFEYKISLFIQNPFYKKNRTGISGIISATYDSRRTATAGLSTTQQFQTQPSAVHDTGSNSNALFQRYIEMLQTRGEIRHVTRDNLQYHQDVIGDVVGGRYVGLILGQDSEILKFWKGVILIPVQRQVGTKSRRAVSYYMLPYRFRKLSGIPCVVFDLWHILSYAPLMSAYAVGGITMTTTQDYMNLLKMLGIELVVGVDMTCNVPGTENGAWPLLTYDLIMKNLQYQESFFQNVGNARMRSARLDPMYDLLPHFLHVSTELNKFLNEIKKASTIPQVLESIHPRGRLVSRRERRFSSNETASYIGLYDYVRRLCGDIDRDETCDKERANLVIKKEVDGREEALRPDEVCQFRNLVVPLQAITLVSIRLLGNYLRENKITFSVRSSQMQALRTAFPLTTAVPDTYIAFYNKLNRLWTVPSLKYAHHGGIPCFYHENLAFEYRDKFKIEINSDIMIQEIRNAKEASHEEVFGKKYTIVGFLRNNTFTPYPHFKEWWDWYKVEHSLFHEGGGRNIKTTSKTRKRRVAL